MSVPDSKPTPATITQLRDLPGVTSDFIIQQLEAGATIEQATASWIKAQADQIKLLAEESERLRQELAKPRSPFPRGGHHGNR